jgi:hypothetical protein
MNFIGASLISICCLLVLTLRPPYAALAFIGGAFYITQGQYIEYLGITITGIRILEAFAFIRVIVRKELAGTKFGLVDKLFIVFFVCYLGTKYVHTGILDSYSLGLCVDGILSYFTFRSLIVRPEDFVLFHELFAIVIIPFTGVMIWEAVTGQNLFAILGGVPEASVIRNGLVRCQGSFRHAITAGSTGATVMPLFISLVFMRRGKVFGVIGAIASGVIVFASSSSGPLLSALVGIICWCIYLIRDKLKTVRLSIALAIIVLHFMMKAPVWFIFDRISGIIGGDGWHRSNIIDQFLGSFDDWWLSGMDMEKTIDWAATTTQYGFADITNYYVSIGINGGLVSLSVFIFILIAILRNIGHGLQSQRFLGNDMNQKILWGIGSAITVNIFNFSAVSYWDQSYVIWYFQMAIAASIGIYCKGNESLRKREYKLHMSA